MKRKRSIRVYALEEKARFGGFGHNLMDGNSTMCKT
jgi:hypothetical protein